MFAAIMKLLCSFGVLIFFMAVALLFGGSCANIIPPNGGPRDSIPPVLLNASPKDSTLNFRGNKITLTFNEYVDLLDVQNQLLFTPLFQNNPKVEVGGKNINVTFRDSLEANTTYILNFGDAIRDYNESNILKGYTYTFSTGPALDSLELTGKVVLAQTGKIDSTLSVILHRKLEDSAVQNSRPQYVVKLDPQGNFRFRNLPAGRFAIYALSVSGSSRQYQNKSTLFAFLDSNIVVGDTSTNNNLMLYAYREEETRQQGGADIQPTRTVQNRLVFTTNLSNNQQDLLNDLVLNFITPLRTFDSAQITLSTDSVFTAAVSTASLDTAKKKITINTQWKENTKYNLVLNADFAADTAGRRLLKTDTLYFNTRKAADYGAVSIRLKTKDSTINPVLQFVQNDLVVFSVPIKSGVFTSNRFLPGEYDLRILNDTNNNGKWDAGSFFVGKKQPELVRSLDRKINIKAGVDNDFEL